MADAVERSASKVPEVTLVFWIIKIAATTLGETGGDTVTMTLNWGYLVGTALFLSLLLVLVILQIAAKNFYPWLYWATIVASTTAGTTMADFADRSLGIGYAGGSSLLFACLMAILGAWYWSQWLDFGRRPSTRRRWKRSTGSRSPSRRLWGRHWAIGRPTIPALAMTAGRCSSPPDWLSWRLPTFCTSTSRVLLFWAAFILTRPLGATVGDFLDKPISDGGLALSRPIASAVIAAFIIALHSRSAATSGPASGATESGAVRGMFQATRDCERALGEAVARALMELGSRPP